MEPTICEHVETVHKVPGLDLQVAECSLCGQLRKFRGSDEPVITRLGRIDGKIVMPKAGQRLEITPEESRLVREGWELLAESEPPQGRRVGGGYDFKSTLGVTKVEAQEELPEEESFVEREPEPDTIPPSPIEAEQEPTPETSPLVETVEKVKTVDQMHKVEKSQYWEKHQEEILKDLADTGSRAMREKWEMSNPGWVGVKKRWLSQE